MKKENNVVKFPGRHKTFRSLANEAANTKEAERGAVIYFDKEGVMHFGELGLERSDVGMMLMYIQMIAVQMMEQRD